jgi:hypothetical protein
VDEELSEGREEEPLIRKQKGRELIRVLISS